MPISIKNPATEKLARELASLTQTSLTDTIHEALEGRLVQLRRERSGRPVGDEIREIVERYQRLPVIADLTEDEILGYDEFGAPTR
jgi:antitoxin VapB